MRNRSSNPATLRHRFARGLGVAGVCVLCGCGSQDRPAPPRAPDDYEAAGPAAGESQTWIDSLRTAERQRLLETGDVARRTVRDRLEITIAAGSTQVFTDEVVDGEFVRLHLYGGWFPAIRAHLVEVIYVPEGGEYLLIDARSGDRLSVDAPPVPSPDGSRFVTASLDLVAGHRPNRIRIYRLDAGVPVIEWEATPRDWGAAAPLWLDSGALRLDRTVVDTSTLPLTLRSAPMQLQRDGTSWRIVP